MCMCMYMLCSPPGPVGVIDETIYNMISRHWYRDRSRYSEYMNLHAHAHAQHVHDMHNMYMHMYM